MAAIAGLVQQYTRWIVLSSWAVLWGKHGLPDATGNAWDKACNAWGKACTAWGSTGNAWGNPEMMEVALCELITISNSTGSWTLQ
jgi:hypothetical protein